MKIYFKKDSKKSLAKVFRRPLTKSFSLSLLIVFVFQFLFLMGGPRLEAQDLQGSSVVRKPLSGGERSFNNSADNSATFSPRPSSPRPSSPTANVIANVLKKPIAAADNREQRLNEQKLNEAQTAQQAKVIDILKNGTHTAEEANEVLTRQTQTDQASRQSALPSAPEAPRPTAIDMPKSSGGAASVLLPIAAIAAVGAIALAPSMIKKGSGEDLTSSSAGAKSWKDPKIIERATTTYQSESLSPGGLDGPGAPVSVTVYDRAKIEDWFKQGNITPNKNGDYTQAVRDLDPNLSREFRDTAATMAGIHQDLIRVEADAARGKVNFACEGSGERSCGLKNYRELQGGLKQLAEYRQRQLAIKRQLERGEGNSADLRQELATLKTNMDNLRSEIGRHVEAAKAVGSKDPRPEVQRLYNNAAGLLEAASKKIVAADGDEIKKMLPHLIGTWNRFVKNSSAFDFTLTSHGSASSAAAATRDLFSATRSVDMMAAADASFGGVLDTHSPHRRSGGDQWISPGEAADFRGL
jgi:hypothetical protein